MAEMLEQTVPNESACAAASADPSLLATDLADYLVRKGVPFRKAHHLVGEVVALAERKGKPLNQIPTSELQTVDKNFGVDVVEVFDLRKAMGKRNLTGAPGALEVQKQLARWQKSLQHSARATATLE